MGSLYRPKLKDWPPRPASDQRSAVWWCKYYVNGRPVRESTGTDRYEEAKRTLKRKEGAAASGAPVMPRLDRIRYEELVADLTAHYTTTGRRRVTEVEDSLAHLTPFFAGRRAVQITPALITEYVAARQVSTTKYGRPPANRTINLELSILRRMLRLAYEHGKVFRVPVIRLLKEAAPRQGFFEREQYRAVRGRLTPALQTAVTIAYTYGWRVQDEVLTLARRHIDLQAGTIRLDPGSTKNDDGRVVYLTPTLKAALVEQLDRVDALGRKLGRIIPCVFPHDTDGPRDPKTGLRRYVRGDRRKDFRKAWRTACKRAGCPGMLRHDFRRTAVRNLVNAGVPERVVMSMTGHKTRSVFDRYHIVSPADLQAASRRLAEADGHVSGHVRAKALDGAARNSAE